MFVAGQKKSGDERAMQMLLQTLQGKKAIVEFNDFPAADVKFFLTASDQARAARRQSELQEKGLSVAVAEVLADQRRRDKDDTERAIAPLKPAPDAVVVDTTDMDLGQVVEECLRIARERLKSANAGKTTDRE